MTHAGTLVVNAVTTDTLAGGWLKMETSKPLVLTSLLMKKVSRLSSLRMTHLQCRWYCFKTQKLDKKLQIIEITTFLTSSSYFQVILVPEGRPMQRQTQQG
jgi:hypothetical protein